MNYNNAIFESASGTADQLPESVCAEICFSGRSNVGKSSLINKLLNRKSLARVSTKPGKTVTINFYSLENIKLVDLPGYGYAKVSKGERARWSTLMEIFFNSDRKISLVIQLIDMRHSPSEFDLDMLQFLTYNNLPFAIALTKSDKLNKTERETRMNLLKEELSFLPNNILMFPFSATNGEGVDELKEIIEKTAQEN